VSLCHDRTARVVRLIPARQRVAFRLHLSRPPPLIAGEDAAGYDELLARIAGTLQPADMLDRSGCATSSTWSGRFFVCAA